MLRTAEDFAQLNRELAVLEDVEYVYDHLTHRALELSPEVHAAGVTIRRKGGRLETPASTADLVNELDQLQYDLGQGPCVEAALPGDQVIRIPDTRHEPRYPQWCAGAAERGVLSTLSIQFDGEPVAADAVPLGGINLYATTPDAFDDETVDATRTFAIHAADIIAATRRSQNLNTALQTRHTIGIAQGILIQAYDLNVDAAFRVLKRIASDHATKLAVVAETVVASKGVPEQWR